MGKIMDWLFGPSEAPQEERNAYTDYANSHPTVDPLADIREQVVVPRLVGEGEALTLSSVYRATQILAVAVKQLGLRVYRDDEEVDSPNWVRRPDIKLSRSAFLEQTTYSLALNGNAFWLITRDSQKRVTNLEVLNPLDVIIDTFDPKYKYSYQGNRYQEDEIKHLSIGRVPGHAKGQGPIQKANAELAGAMDLSDYSGNWFKTAGVPTGVLSTDAPLNPDQASETKRAWTTTQGGMRSVAVLGNGLSYSPVYLNPAEAQFIENQKFSVTQVARMFGIPARLLLATVDGGSMTYANLEQDEITFVRYTLSNYIVEIEDAFSSLLPGRQEAKFNVEALLRTDTLTRYQSFEIALRNKWMTPDEVRKIENLRPLTAKEKKELNPPAPAPTQEESNGITD